jgi:cytochrome c peroxidase
LDDLEQMLERNRCSQTSTVATQSPDTTTLTALDKNVFIDAGMDDQRHSKASSNKPTLPFQMQIKPNLPDNWQRFGRGWRDCNKAIESAKSLRKLSQDVTGKNTFASIRIVDESGKQLWVETP